MSKSLPFSTLKIQESDIKLIVLFILIVILIFLRSYFNPDGYLSPDSTHYLQMAQNLLNGKGFKIPDLSSEKGYTIL